jgi:uncharacterized protein (TIGR02217 family)
VSDLIFPLLRGVGWNTKLTPHHFFGKQQARSGRTVRAQFSSQPVMKISISYSDQGFLSEDPGQPSDDGTAVYSDFETMLGFFNYHGGGFQSFLFQGVNCRERKQFTRAGELQFTGDSATTTFQLVRNLGIWAQAIYCPQGAPTIYVGGAQQAPANVTALGNGMFQLSAAPAAGALITADFTFAYRCVFDAEELEFTNWSEGYWSVDTPLITVKP